MVGPASIKTTTKLASMRQIQAAIEHHGKQNWECAITLAAAAEGMLPATDEPHFRQKVKKFAASLPDAVEGANSPSDVITWLKHGTANGKKCEKATIENSEAPVVIWRAITKFYAVYSEVSPQMQSWQQTMKDALSERRRLDRLIVREAFSFGHPLTPELELRMKQCSSSSPAGLIALSGKALTSETP